MKNKIYNEIKTMETSSNDIIKRKGRTIRILADTISCFKCIDTKRSLKNKNNSQYTTINSKINYDIIGCYNCNNVGWISCSHTNNFTENGFILFHVDNNNWIERIEQLYNKASIDTYIMKKVTEWLNEINNLKVEEVEHIQVENVKFENVQVKNVKIENVKNETIKLDTVPLFEVCKRITKEHIEKSLDLEIEVGIIIDIVKNTVEAYFGNIFPLVNLTKELKVSFSISNSHSMTKDKLIKIKDNNYLGIKTCTRITQNVIKTSLFGKNKFAKEYTADIFILKPLNQKATEKANIIMGKIAEEMTDDILLVF